MLDLHIHSTASDGTDTPEVILAKCRKLGLSLTSITDHDTIDAQEEALDIAGGLKLKYITGIEFSVKHLGELHILGYGVDISNPVLKETMADLKKSRVKRVHAILEELNSNNVKISFEDVKRHAKGNTLGRPHVAMAMIEKGYAASLQDSFNRYLNESGLCYVQRRKLNPRQAIDLINESGGASVLAHPKFIKTNDIDALVGELKSYGLMGIEAYYPAHSDYELQKFLGIAKKHGLLVTAGSDYHGALRPVAALACEKRTGAELEKSMAYLTEKYA